MTAARGSRQLAPGAIVGQPASAGRATGPIRLVTGPADFADFAEGDVRLAATTAPAFTPLFARAAAVVTDGGTLAAHASLIAREYGIPAVVGTGDATRRLRTGQLVTVDGGAGTVTPTSSGRDGALPHVPAVQDLHASKITSGLPVLSAHVVVEDSCFFDGHTAQVLDQLQDCVAAHFPVSVEHSTFQLEMASHSDHEHAAHA